MVAEVVEVEPVCSVELVVLNIADDLVLLPIELVTCFQVLT